MDVKREAWDALAKIPKAGANESPSSYLAYVEAAIREDLTCQECQALMAVYGCPFEKLADRIVFDRMHRKARR